MSYQPYTPPVAAAPAAPVTAAAGSSTTAATMTTVPATPTTPSTTATTYPYSAYHPSAYATTPGAYAYAAQYQTGVTGYGWSYPYSYIQHPQAAAQIAALQAQNAHAQAIQSAYRPVLPVGTSTAMPATSTAATPTAQRTATFSAYTPSYPRDTVASRGGGGKRQSNFKGLFQKDLKNLMYGFGDDRNPSNDTVNVMEEILIEYITDVCQQAAGPSKKTRLSIDDLRRALSHPADAKKLARLEELLFMQEDIKRARAQFEADEIPGSKGI